MPARTGFCTIFHHLLLYWPIIGRLPPPNRTCSLSSRLMLSIHPILGLPFAHVPLTSVFIVCFALFSHPFTESLLLSSLLFLSLSITPSIRLDILISVVSKNLILLLHTCRLTSSVFSTFSSHNHSAAFPLIQCLHHLKCQSFKWFLSKKLQDTIYKKLYLTSGDKYEH